MSSAQGQAIGGLRQPTRQLNADCVDNLLDQLTSQLVNLVDGCEKLADRLGGSPAEVAENRAVDTVVPPINVRLQELLRKVSDAQGHVHRAHTVLG